jgi:hypothetical protein
MPATKAANIAKRVESIVYPYGTPAHTLTSYNKPLTRLDTMNRYKGRTNPTLIERDFPHHVEVPVPLGGLGERLDAMHDWHRVRRIQAMRGRSRRDENGCNYILWCFADPRVAAQFVNAFGGAVGKLDVGRSRKSKPRPDRQSRVKGAATS